jgi:hypothetical protein
MATTFLVKPSESSGGLHRSRPEVAVETNKRASDMMRATEEIRLMKTL